MAAGDLISVPCEWKGIPYRHFGIDLGDGDVMHLARDESGPRVQDLQSMRVRRSPLAIFCGGRQPRTESVVDPLPIEETLSRAFEQEGEEYYHLTEKNCEHFARWCKTGSEASHQVDFIHSQARCIVSTSTKVMAAIAKRSAASATLLAVVAPRIVAGKWIPSAIASDIVDLGVATTAKRMGYGPNDSKQIGLIAGCATAGVVGFLAGGPVGSSTLIGVHLASTQFADRIVDTVSKRVGSLFSRQT